VNIYFFLRKTANNTRIVSKRLDYILKDRTKLVCTMNLFNKIEKCPYLKKTLTTVSYQKDSEIVLAEQILKLKEQI